MSFFVGEANMTNHKTRSWSGLWVICCFLFLPNLVTAQRVIFEDNFDDGLLDSRWTSDWGQYASEGYVAGTATEFNPYLAWTPSPRPDDVPGKITTGVVGFTTFTDPSLEVADAVVSINDIDISTITMDNTDNDGVHLALVGRYGTDSGDITSAIMGNYTTAYGGGPRIYFHEQRYNDWGEGINFQQLPRFLESPLHMEMTIEGDDVTYTVGDAFGDYTITMVNGTHYHYFQMPHFRRHMPDPGRWGFYSGAAVNSSTDYMTWDNFLLTELPGDGLAGDYNGDQVVDAADYTVWRDGDSPDSTAAGYALWAENFGSVAGASSSAIPEPAALLLCTICLGLLLPIFTWRQRSQVTV